MAPRISENVDWVLQRLRDHGVEARIEGDRLIITAQGETRVAFEIVPHFEHLSEERVRDLTTRRRIADGESGSSTRPLLVTPWLSKRSRGLLRKAGVAWAEYRTGAAFIQAPGILLSLEESPGWDTRAAEIVLDGKAGLVVEALLLARDAEQGVKLNDIEAVTDVSRSWISRTVKSLVAAGAVEASGSGPRKVWKPRPEALLDLWARQASLEPDRRSGAYVWAQRPGSLLRRLTNLTEGDLGYAVGGIAAANLWEPSLTTEPDPEVWLPAGVPPAEVAERLGGELVDSGANLVFWQKAGDAALKLSRVLGQSLRAPRRDDLEELRLVSRPRAYVEAIHGAGRAEDVAANLREALISRRSATGA